MPVPASLSIILPCFNPHEGWVENIASSYAAIAEIIPGTELIIVNDGSSAGFDREKLDGLVEKFAAIKTISYEINRGKGYALREGVKQAKCDTVIYTDIDFPYTEKSFFKILSALKEGDCDLAVGIRNEEYYTHLPQNRVRISKFLRWLIRKFLKIPTSDTQCGLKGFTRRGKEIFLQTTIDRYLFDLEFIFLAARKKAVIKLVEVELKPGVLLSKMRWQILLQELGNFLKIFYRTYF
jgi:glycosyltransferase involved in cell wall biosynthesis